MSTKFKPEFKAKLLAALRSGDYKQGRLALRKDDAFCCLGVACDVAVKEGYVNGAWDRLNDGSYSIYDKDSDDRDCASLPCFIQRVVFENGSDAANPLVDLHEDLKEINAKANRPHEGASLMGLNDHWNLSFAEIADYIEEQL